VIQHEDSIGQSQYLVQFGGDHEYGRAGVTFDHYLGVDILDRPHVDPPGRLGGDDELDIPVELTCHDHLLLIAAGQC
jgi:hypothetical protein